MVLWVSYTVENIMLGVFVCIQCSPVWQLLLSSVAAAAARVSVPGARVVLVCGAENLAQEHKYSVYHNEFES